MRKSYVLYRRADGGKGGKVYYAAFWNKDTQSYENVRSTGQTAKAYADEQARKWLEEGVPGTSGDIFYDYLAGFWAVDGAYAKLNVLRGRPLSAEYLLSMRSAVGKYVLPYLEQKKLRGLPVTRVTAAHLEGLVLHLSESTELGARRINSIRQAVSVPLSEARRLGKIRHNPMTEVLKLKETKPTREILSLQEARKILGDPWPDERLRLINMLAAATGMRMGECRGLQREDIMRNNEDCEIQVRHNWQEGEGLKPPKWGSVRRVPLPARIAESLLELAAANPWGNEFVFYGNRRDLPVSKRSVDEAFNEAVRGLGISEEERRRRGLTFHSWRHWYESYLRGRIPDHALQQLTRHQSDRMLDRYSHVTEEQRKAVAELGESLF